MADNYTEHQKNNLNTHDEHSGAHHIVSIPLYLTVFGILMIGTVLTVGAAYVDLDYIFPGANTLVALAIAFFKMGAVVLIFMHVRWSSKLIWLTVLAGFFWLAIMFAFTMQDYLTRAPGVFPQ
ncbi:MAG: caa(3)-type oxidase, subunit [Acidobacteria bacterium]|jgi:cytochrome c oxidase subunit 4|nr:caa(3)-type oxidase, subunit [Acidobacteriota bacterium]